MTEQEARDLFQEIAVELALPAGWSLRFDSSTRRFGQCNYAHRIISLSRRLAGLNGPKEVGSVIRHEIAHALVGPEHGHDWVWKAMCVKCGGDGKRCYSAEAIATPDAPWIAECPVCRRKLKRHRQPKPGRKLWCAACYHTSNREAAVLAFTFNGETTSALPVSLQDTGDVQRVLALRASGLGYVAIDAAFGIHGKKGWWSWKIVRDSLTKA